MITDQQLINATYSGNTTGRSFAVVYRDGRKVHFTVASKQQARAYGREYGARFLAGAVVHSVEEVTA